MSNDKKPTADKIELQEWQIISFLQDVEASNVARDAVNLLRICNDNPRLYGTKGAPLCRAYQREFDKIKRYSIDKYIQTLDHLQIDPSEATLCIQRTMPAPMTAEDAAVNTAAVDNADLFGGNNGTDDDFASGFTNLNMADDDEEEDYKYEHVSSYEDTEDEQFVEAPRVAFLERAPLKPPLSSFRLQVGTTGPLLRLLSNVPRVAPTPCPRHLHHWPQAPSCRQRCWCHLLLSSRAQVVTEFQAVLVCGTVLPQ
jgi:hypothetical protein